MSEVDRIADQLERAHSGNAWHGPSVSEVLRDVDAATAADHPIASAHSIWEIVLHVALWTDVVRQRLAGEAVVDPPAEEDWSAAIDESAASWSATIDRLDRVTNRLQTAIVALDDRHLDEIVPDKGISKYLMLHGLVQHNLYHAGQIVLLKKATQS